MLSRPGSRHQKNKICPSGTRFFPLGFQAKRLTCAAWAFSLSIALTRFDRQFKSRTYHHHSGMPVNHRLQVSASFGRKQTIPEGDRRRLTPGFMRNGCKMDALPYAVKFHLGALSSSASENIRRVVSEAAATIQIYGMSRESFSNERDSFAQKPRSRD